MAAQHHLTSVESQNLYVASSQSNGGDGGSVVDGSLCYNIPPTATMMNNVAPPSYLLLPMMSNESFFLRPSTSSTSTPMEMVTTSSSAYSSSLQALPYLLPNAMFPTNQIYQPSAAGNMGGHHPHHHHNNNNIPGNPYNVVTTPSEGLTYTYLGEIPASQHQQQPTRSHSTASSSSLHAPTVKDEPFSPPMIGRNGFSFQEHSTSGGNNIGHQQRYQPVSHNNFMGKEEEPPHSSTSSILSPASTSNKTPTSSLHQFSFPSTAASSSTAVSGGLHGGEQTMQGMNLSMNKMETSDSRESSAVSECESSTITHKSTAVTPDDTQPYMTPEGAFLCYQRKPGGLTCQVCDEIAAGFHHGAYVCEACKKFFMRHANSESSITNPCPTGGHCVISKVKRGKCQSCRFQKCKHVGMHIKDPLASENFDISKIPCRVCGNNSSGFHFGALTCEGCKGFFRRTDRPDVKLVCKFNNNCPIRNGDRNSCKSCRYNRCRSIGMSRLGSRIGRQPNAVKYHCAQEIRKINRMSSSSSDNNNNRDGNVTQTQSPFSQPRSVPSSEVTDLRIRQRHSGCEKDEAENRCSPEVSSSMESSLPFVDVEKLRSDLMNSVNCLFSGKEMLKSAFALNSSPFSHETIEVVWHYMMSNFELHTRHVVRFAKSVYGFSLLEISAQRRLVRNAMYPLMLLDLSRDYNMAADEYNYFDFSRQERESILHHFPSFEKIARHVRDSGRLIKPLEFDRMELTLLSILELYKSYEGYEAPFVMQLFHVYQQIFDEYLISKYGARYEERKHVLLEISPVLERMNQEHHEIIAQLKINRAHLQFPKLYVETFQLTAAPMDSRSSAHSTFLSSFSGGFVSASSSDYSSCRAQLGRE